MEMLTHTKSCRTSNLKTIIVPEIFIIEIGAFDNCKELTDFYCYSFNVPTTWCNFDGSYIEYATLHVPESSIELYKNTEPWSRFKNFVALTDEYPNPTKINSIISNDNGKSVDYYYDLRGKRLYNARKGLNIIREMNGSTRKVIMK